MDQNFGTHASSNQRRTFTAQAQGRTQAQAQHQQQQSAVPTAPEGDQSGYQGSLPDMATETIEIPITVPKATYETAQAIEGAAIALIDGWPNAQGVMAQGALIASVLLQHVLPAMQNLNSLGADYESNKLQFFDALSVGLRPIVERYVK